MKSFDFNLLKVLHSLMLTHSVTRTAEEMKMTPGAISHALNRLRVLFSDQLFVRSGNKLAPTQLTLRLFPLSGDVITSIERFYNSGMRTSLDEAASYVETIRIRCQDVVELLLISPIQQRIARNNIQLDIQSTSVESRDGCLAGLHQRKFDVLLDTQPSSDRSLVSAHIMTTTPVLICRAGHPRVLTSISEEQLRHEEFVSNYSVNELCCLLQTPNINVAHSTPYLLSRYGLVASTDYISLSSLPVAKYFQKFFHLQILEYSMPIDSISVYMTYHHTLKNSPSIAFLKNAFEEEVVAYFNQA